MEDSAIVTLFNERNERAIKETKEKYGARLRKLAASVSGDSRTAEECENDTYLAAWNRIPPDDPSAHMFAYLARIIRCRVIDRVRASGSRRMTELSAELIELIPSDDDIESSVSTAYLREIINDFLSGENEGERKVFIRRYFYFDSIAEISLRCGYSLSKTKSILFRMRNRLKQRLGKEGYDV
ncbi:MAG: RNA polymerase sigma factor [Oscillospiraceae bacterium]|nr:RNA polymerase sigma factor [Oscillospiraceae bacterium]